MHFGYVEGKPVKKALPKKPKTIKEDDKPHAGQAVSNRTSEAPRRPSERSLLMRKPKSSYRWSKR